MRLLHAKASFALAKPAGQVGNKVLKEEWLAPVKDADVIAAFEPNQGSDREHPEFLARDVGGKMTEDSNRKTSSRNMALKP